MPKRFIDIPNRETGPSRLDLRTQKADKKIQTEQDTDSQVAETSADILDLSQAQPKEEKAEKDIIAEQPKKEAAPEIDESQSPAAPKTDTEPLDLWEEHENKEPDDIFPETDAAETVAETPAPKPAPPKPKADKPKWIMAAKTAIAVVIVLLMVGVAMFGQAFFSGANIFNQEGTNTLDQIKHLVLSSDKMLQGEADGRINVLLLGMGGEGHDGAMLTDTIIVMSINTETREVAMLSLPRDMWVENEEFGYSRINKINYYGEQENPGHGPEYIRDTVEEITGLDIPYYLAIDFAGFSDIVDSLGGVEIDVENGFKDTEYPGANYGYMTVEFERGPQTMDGEKALQYARSRHGVITDPDPDSEVTNEASDFARSRRQQKLIAAIKDKALTSGVLANPQKLNSLFNALDKHIQTNAQMWEGWRLFELGQEFDVNNVRVSVISNEEFLKVYTTPDGAYTLIPVDGFGEYGKIQEFALNIFDQAEALHGEEIAVPEGEAPEEERPSEAGEEDKQAEEETATIAVQNGTLITGLGARVGNELRAAGFEVTNVGNAADQTRQHTVIYDNTGGAKPAQLAEIAETYEADAIAESAPLNKTGGKEEADFVIILGQEAAGYNEI